MGHRRLLLLLGVAALGSGCSGAPGSDEQPLLVDERAGTVEGVGLRDSARTLTGAFGDPVEEGNGSAQYPERPRYLPLGLPARFADERPLVLRFGDRSFLGTRSRGALQLFIWNSRARTRRGVGVGDRLREARRRYPGTRCGVLREPEALSVSWPVCAAPVGRRFIAFGEDPITSIAVSDVPFDGFP